MSLLNYLTAFSQKTILINQDTSICFSVKQSKFLLKNVFQNESLDTLLNLERQTTTQQLVKIELLQNNILLEEQKNKNLGLIIENKDVQNAFLNETIKDLKKEIKVQKIKKIAVGILGFVTSSLFLYLYLTK